MKLGRILRGLAALSLISDKEQREKGRQSFLAQLLGGRRAETTAKEKGSKGERVRGTYFGGGKHYRGSRAKQCERCGATLSHGKCANRLCPQSGLQDGGLLADRRDYRRALQMRLESSKSPERRARIEAQIAEVERQIKALRAAA